MSFFSGAVNGAFRFFGLWSLSSQEDSEQKVLSETPPVSQEVWNRFARIERSCGVPTRLIRALEEDCPYFGGKKVKETHKLVYMPSQINGKNMSPDTYREEVLSERHDPHFFGIHGKATVDKGYWFLITKLPIPESKRKTMDQQQMLLKQGYRLPHIIEAEVTASMSQLNHEHPIFSDGNNIRCLEKVDQWPIVVGLSEDSVNVTFCDWNDYNGIAAVRA